MDPATIMALVAAITGAAGKANAEQDRKTGQAQAELGAKLAGREEPEPASGGVGELIAGVPVESLLGFFQQGGLV